MLFRTLSVSTLSTFSSSRIVPSSLGALYNKCSPIGSSWAWFSWLDKVSVSSSASSDSVKIDLRASDPNSSACLKLLLFRKSFIKATGSTSSPVMDFFGVLNIFLIA